MAVPLDRVIQTPRLLLRRVDPADAERFSEIQSNWNVVRMLRLATFPVTVTAMRTWLAAHEDEWRTGTAHRFSVVFNDQVVGCADINEIRAGRGDLGYWFDEAVWGQGLAGEAGAALIGWGFQALGLGALGSGCASDNPASAAVLTKLGFRRVGVESLWSNPRGEPISQLRFTRDAAG